MNFKTSFIGFPRQLGQHTGGFVVTQGKLTDLCPISNARMQNRTNIEWNKDDIDALGFLKVDVLALGMLTCIRKAFDLCKKHYDLDLTLVNIPQDDPEVYKMISHADTLGVFQIESRAQMYMDFVNGHSGQASNGATIKERPNYVALKDYFDGKITLDKLKEDNGC